MNDELQLGKYEFFPYEDEREDNKDILEELKKLLTTDEKIKKHQADILEKTIKRRKKVRKK